MLRYVSLPIPDGCETSCAPRDPWHPRHECGSRHRYDAQGKTGWHLVPEITWTVPLSAPKEALGAASRSITYQHVCRSCSSWPG